MLALRLDCSAAALTTPQEAKTLKLLGYFISLCTFNHGTTVNV